MAWLAAWLRNGKGLEERKEIEITRHLLRPPYNNHGINLGQGVARIYQSEVHQKARHVHMQYAK